MADHRAVDLGQQALLGPIRRVAQGAEERLAVRAVEDVEQRLVDRFVVGFGAEAVLDRAAAKRQAIPPARSFHRVDHLGTRRAGRGLSAEDQEDPTLLITHALFSLYGLESCSAAR